ncbi:hypothetical protein CUU02_01845 [Klebsiella pneumoniae]|uniref:hypothetical protein n=1 Tax=Enterobacteriaceae TaxID=543 RepID=UPI000C210400|nr:MULTISPECIES: hypothetical protein [Enterobacteriaceae]MCJ1817094.1 hypothetical protein [Klebsiella quasipneumoniae subsp. similipneumoniae]PJG89203.1 hypothetical protein CUT95_13075 [Klebsiella pneumoniae]PJG94461.1 hypothetical protein CUT94_12555 [Klebsiella pneumoniae]PJH00335.1 hypothetical protein CUT93_09025 [Klebsiella pneumoniae]PJH05173.1 hypothetical protein CUU00_13200 [Klebsiella pneumoniae]
MATITKIYEKIAPKLDDMVRRGFSDIELKYGSQNEIYAYGERKLSAEDFRKLYPEKVNDIPQDFPPDATVIVEDMVLLYKPRNGQLTRTASETQLKHHQAFNDWCHANVGKGKGYTQTTKNTVNTVNIIGAIVLVGLIIWGLSHLGKI